MIIEERMIILHPPALPEPLLSPLAVSAFPACTAITRFSRKSTELAPCPRRQGQLSWGNCSIWYMATALLASLLLKP